MNKLACAVWVMWLGLGAVLFAVDGLFGLVLSLVLLLTILFIDRLTPLIIRSSRFRHTLMIILPTTVIFGVFCLFAFAFLRGADAVATIPRWLWYAASIYSAIAIGLVIRLDRWASRGQPLNPPPRANSV